MSYNAFPLYFSNNLHFKGPFGSPNCHVPVYGTLVKAGVISGHSYLT